MKHLTTVISTLVCMACSPAWAADSTITTPHLTGMDNFRDIAGTTTAYSTSNDGVMRQGVFYRANALTPTAADLAVLNTLNISTVIDLRTPDEIAATPDTVPAGAQWININLLGSASTSAFNMATATPASVNQMMADAERSFVNDAATRTKMAGLLRELASADGAAIFHCTAGKDRTGWTAAILQSIAGVSSSDIMANYLATNDYTATRINATVAMLPASMASTYSMLMGVQANWLQAGFDQIATDYGSVDRYLKEGLGLDQATLYVLRAKMVLYSTLPGQAGFNGNAAAGAALLSSLQTSPLSGTYSAYNYYLQSAIDSGTLGGLEKQIGGQVHADAASYLVRESSALNDVLAGHSAGTRLQSGASDVWINGLAAYQGNDGGNGVSSSNEHSAGTMIGATHRFSDRAAVSGGVGYNRGTVGSAGGDVTTNNTFVALGARLALNDLENGPWAALLGNAGYIDYQSDRYLGNGLGKATGDTNGNFVGGRASLGWLLNPGPLVIDPMLGVQVSHLNLDGFQEKGSELALNVAGQNSTQTSIVAGIGLRTRDLSLGEWALAPGVNVGYQRLLNDASMASSGSLYGYDISQSAASQGKNRYTAGISLRANWRNITLDASANGLETDKNSHGASGSLQASVSF